MTTANIAPNNRVKSLAARIAWFVLICATLYVCYFSHLGTIGFIGPDEPRYAWVAREMAETGDWVTPRLYGNPWFEKPPLFYWGAAISFKLFGVSEAAARLPSAISALLATLAMAWLAWRLYGTQTSRWLLLLLPTTVGMIGFSHAAATDMPFSAMLTIAMVCAATLLPVECGGSPPLSQIEHAASKLAGPPPIAPARSAFRSFTFSLSFTSILFGLFLGLAVLAKGPAALILCGGSFFFWALFTKRWRAALRLFHPAAIAAFCLAALPWYILCARRNPDFLRVFLIEHNFKRYLTPEFQHLQPFWFYIPILCIALLPWTLATLISTRFLTRSWPRFNSQDLFLICWAIVPVVFFSVSKSKLPGYVLPAIPPLGLIIADALTVRVSQSLPASRWISVSTGTSLIALGISAFLQIKWLSFGWAPAMLTAGGLVMLMLMLSVRPRLESVLLICATTVVATVALAFVGSTGWILDQRLSARPAARIAPMIWKDYSPERASTYKLRRSFQFSLNFYSHRELPAWSLDSRSEWVFAPRSEIGYLRNQGLNCPVDSSHSVIVCEEPALATAPPGSR